MDEQLKIFVDRLRHGETETFEEVVTPEFLDLHEKDLQFKEPVHVNGQAYLAEEVLVLHIDVKATATIPCRICNEPTKAAVEVKGLYYTVPLEEIKGAVYDYHEALRETILIETPTVVECHQGKCPQRAVMKRFLKQESQDKGNMHNDDYRPFANLDLDIKS